jgi:ubiquinone/menaquinone biosynthesis C-methylase UbiE
MSKADKGYIGVGMEGPIASWYAKTTLKDIKRHRLLAQELAGRLAPGSRVLEIAPGPGYFCIELARLGDYEIYGLDISQSFVEIARKNASEAGVKVDFRLGNAAQMPFDDASFDFTVCQAAFKNFSQPVAAIGEMYRVLRPGGTSLIIDLRRDAPREEVDREVNGMGLGTVNRLLTRWSFDAMLLKRAYTRAEMQQFAERTPFRSARIEEEGIGFRVWLEKSAA